MHFCQGGRAPFSPEGMRENSDVKKEVYSFVYPLSALHISMYWVRSHERVRAELLEFADGFLLFLLFFLVRLFFTIGS